MTPMDTALNESSPALKKNIFIIPALFAGAGCLFFIFLATADHPEKAWLAYLTNFLMFTSISAGGLLFSTLMHFTKATSNPRLTGVAEAFSAFFPVSFILFILLFLGQEYVFTWKTQDLHGKEIWLNVPFLFTRDFIGFLILYILGFGFLYQSLKFRLKGAKKDTRFKQILLGYFENRPQDSKTTRRRMTIFAGWYMFAFAMVIGLTGFDLVMSMDPHWYSTLFGAYTFIKAIYIGFGALILMASVLHLNPNIPFTLLPSQLRDISTLFFGFSIVWGDFFYSQFLVIWYGNIPEETAYIIERTMAVPWRYLAWTVFLICFIMPFLILINGKIKESPRYMITVCSFVLTGMWIEHFLLLGPCYLGHGTHSFPLGISELIVTLGFLALLIIAVLFYFKQFPDVLEKDSGEAVQWK